MQWDKGQRSDNVEQASGGRGLKIGGGLGLGGVAIVVVFGLLSGQSPTQILGTLISLSDQGAPTQQQNTTPANTQQVDFVRTVLGETENTWTRIFQAHGEQYQPPKLVLFNGQVQSGCGGATAASGPFYCPVDGKVYLDLSFFQELQQRFGADGDFARAYVIAHEVGHHVQNLTGTTGKMEAARRRGIPTEGATGLSVRLELQADCYAGVWAHDSQQRLNWLEPGDLEKALNAANAIGDDRLQRQAQGRVVPDSFTHGSSAQRVKWFRTGFDSGKVESCNTFATQAL
ncbi:KPN_02809 family neutral zinc metallopeptidase [Pseudomonas oryzihabitans]|uniref:KPN_02809 family neutral zinc metallopeptidase n=1 Tax=Pseudomonas oryzihabitans TaxID=47885 RepID=UPI0011226E31|nr:neutral zinc metallopeptidase [Pseudomonas psychrotolerans]QDD91704.1 neutral zinc metallopeptidase [Pseudomonas psychrotolerans]